MAKNPKAGKTNYNVTQKQFVRIWETSNNLDEAVERLKMPKPIVLARVSNYRAAGVALKKMPRAVGRALDVEGLNKLIDQIRAGENAEE